MNLPEEIEWASHLKEYWCLANRLEAMSWIESLKVPSKLSPVCCVNYVWKSADTFRSLHSYWLLTPKLKKYCNNNNITVWTSSGSSGKFLLNRKSLQNRAAWPRVASVWIRMDPCDSCSCLQFKLQRHLTARFYPRKMIALLDNWRKPVYLTRRWWEEMCADNWKCQSFRSVKASWWTELSVHSFCAFRLVSTFWTVFWTHHCIP